MLDERALALGAAVAEVVGPEDDGAVGDEPLGHVLVAAGVLAVAVGQQDDEGGVRGSARCGRRLPRSPSISVGFIALSGSIAHAVGNGPAGADENDARPGAPPSSFQPKKHGLVRQFPQKMPRGSKRPP